MPEAAIPEPVMFLMAIDLASHSTCENDVLGSSSKVTAEVMIDYETLQAFESNL